MVLSAIPLESRTHLPQGLCTCRSGCLALCRLSSKGLPVSAMCPPTQGLFPLQMAFHFICLLCAVCWAINSPQLDYPLPAPRGVEGWQPVLRVCQSNPGGSPLDASSRAGSLHLPEVSPPPLPPQGALTTLWLAQSLGSHLQAGKRRRGHVTGTWVPSCCPQGPQETARAWG